MNSTWITDFARDAASSQSFEYSTFADARTRLSYNNRCYKKYIVYDRLSLSIYKHNLSPSEYQQFCRELSHLYTPPTNDYDKYRKEYAVLFHYCLCKPKLAKYAITKSERPDFLLRKGNLSIGIEVTQLTTSYEKVMEKISSLSENGITADELRT